MVVDAVVLVWAEGRAGEPGEVSSPQRISLLRLLSVQADSALGRVAGEGVERKEILLVNFLLFLCSL